MGKSQVRRPKGSEGCPEVTVRERKDELTLRAEEVERGRHTSMSTTQKRRGAVLPLVDYDWYAFCQALYKGIEGEDWGELYDAYREMSRAVGVKKPQEAPKAKALWTMKAAKDAGEEYCDSTRKDNIQGRSETRLALWEEHLKDPFVALDRALKCVENSW